MLHRDKSIVSQKEAVPVAAAKVKPLDLSTLLRDAFLAGRGLKDGDRLSDDDRTAWCAYDPERMNAYNRICAALYASPAPAGEPGISERLYDADEPMADGEIRMTAAENVLGWLLIEKIGVPDDRNYSPNEAQEILVRRLDYANEMENERIRSALHPTPTPVSAPVRESSPVPTHECDFRVGQPVHMAPLYAEMDPALVFYVTGISWEYRRVSARGWNITVASKEDIEKGWGQTDGFTPDDLLPARSPAVEGK